MTFGPIPFRINHAEESKDAAVIRGTNVSFEYEYEPPEDEAETLMLDVSASISDYYPAVMYLNNGDPGYPAEGGEVEDLTVIGPDGITWDDIPHALLARLEDMARDCADI